MNDKPLYQMLYDDIVAKINNGTYSEKNPLPTERELCDMYHVSRSTVRKALEVLRSERFIKTIHGSGNYVQSKMYYQPLTRFHSFSNFLAGKNITLKTIISDYDLIDCDDYLKNTIEKWDYTKWHRLVRVRYDDKGPLMIETCYLPRNRFYHIDIEHLKNNSLYKYLSSYYNMIIDDAEELLSPIIPTKEEAKALNINTKTACMLFERTCYEEGEVITVHRTIVRGDKYKFKNIFINENNK